MPRLLGPPSTVAAIWLAGVTLLGVRSFNSAVFTPSDTLRGEVAAAVVTLTKPEQAEFL